MKLIALLKSGLTSLYQSVKRFPFTIFLTTFTTVLLIVITRTDGVQTVETLTRIAMTAALGVPLTLSIALAFERLRPSPAAEYGSYALAFFFLSLYYFFLLPEFAMVPVTRYTATTLALYLVFLSVPYIFRHPGFELYVIKVASRFLVTALYSSVLFAGLALTLLTIDLLLGIDVSSTFYANVGMVVAGIFAPSFFLAGLPASEQSLDEETYPTLLKVLLLYIVMPIILTYTSILYIYFLKILFTLEWPQGTVSHLVLWYSAFSAGIIFLISPLREENRFVRFFTTWFPKLVLPALGVMFIAIAIRINAYGVTENRYFVVALGLWVLGIMLYYNVAKGFRNIILPVSLALITFLSVFGPWSAYAVSRTSQNARFEALVAEYNMVTSDTLQQPDREISDQDKRTLVSILEYFASSHSLNDIRLLPPGFQFEDMEGLFGFSREDIWADPGRLDYFHLSGQVKSLDVRNYDYLLSSSTLQRESVTVGGLTVTYSDELRLTVMRGGQKIYAKDLRVLGEEVVAKHGTGALDIPVEDMTFSDENAEIQVKLILTGVQGSTDPAGQAAAFNYFEFQLLIRDKR